MIPSGLTSSIPSECEKFFKGEQRSVEGETRSISPSSIPKEKVDEAFISG